MWKKPSAILLSNYVRRGEREVPSHLVGKLAMNELKELDKVAYIRFASVYLSFDNINEFTKEI